MPAPTNATSSPGPSSRSAARLVSLIGLVAVTSFAADGTPPPPRRAGSAASADAGPAVGIASQADAAPDAGSAPAGTAQAAGGAPDAGTAPVADAVPTVDSAAAAGETGGEGSPEDRAMDKRLEGIDEESPTPQVPSRLASPPIASAKSIPPEQDLLARARKVGGRYVVGQGDSARTLTVDVALQEELTRILDNYRVPYGAVVALEPSTGRVLAMAERSHAQPGLRGLTTQALFPAASIFKIVTAAALLAEGVTAEQEECFHGGKRRLHRRLLEDSQRDWRCHTLAVAMGRSANVVFAKLTLKHLSTEKLRAAAEALRFNRPLPFEVPTGISLAAIPEDSFGLATTAAGFGDVYLSPLHGAMLAAAVANRGLWRQPVLFEQAEAERAPAERVLSEAHALALADMMEQTVTQGTARRIFRQRGHRVEGAVGKTGSLADRNPFRDYSWFVGYAPKDDPKVVVSAVVVNDPLWHIRATWLGREALRLYLDRVQPARSARSAGGPAR